MASIEPVILLFGSSGSISTINLRLPVSFVFAIDEKSLEELITVNSSLTDTCLKRYFVVLLETVSDDVIIHMQTNHRVAFIYSRDILKCLTNPPKSYRIVNKQMEQFTLDITADIVRFYTSEGEKQEKLERVDLTKVYYRQARFIKEWAMSFVKAQPCHILIIPLNSTRENLKSAQERLQNFCTTLGYPSTTIRTLDNYIPSCDDGKLALLPYARALFDHEYPVYVCQLIRKLSPLRLYLYGNEGSIDSEWSKLMISRETEVMEDEDNWCAFIENECIDDEMKWNLGTMFGRGWQMKRLAPINLNDLDRNLRFQSALRRALKTFNHRQTEVTSEIFDWYDKCISDGHLQLEPKHLLGIKDKPNSDRFLSLDARRIFDPSSFHYYRTSKPKGISFIWLDEILNSSDPTLNKIVEPSRWSFFNNVSSCLSFLENQLREHNEIFLIVSGTLGYELFTTAYRFMSTIRFVYVYCSRLGLHGNWIKYYPQIRGVFNDSYALGENIIKDIKQVHQTHEPLDLDWKFLTNPMKEQVCDESDHDQTSFFTPVMVYNREKAGAFMAHQRTIDTLLSQPFTDESRGELIAELRRVYRNHSSILTEIDIFEQTYHPGSALQWYTRDTFLFRIINKALRSSDANMMFNMRYFLIDLYAQLESLHKQTYASPFRPSMKEKLYRGQLISKTELDYFK